MVCDDEEIVLQSISVLLEMKGYTVICSIGAHKALDAAASHTEKIPLLITDVIMPEMNGWELAKKLTQEHPDMKVIFMSGYAEDVLETGAAASEHLKFLEKFPQGDALFQRIREVLDARRRPAP